MPASNEKYFYLRPVNGDDANDGLSYDTAWQTWTKVIDETCISSGTHYGDINNSCLFLVDEGDYSGPWHGTVGSSVSVDAVFGITASLPFTVCGLASNGVYDKDVNFVFDLTSFTGKNWFYAFGITGFPRVAVNWRNITWKNAVRTGTDSIIFSSYDSPMNLSVFENCIFEDNEVERNLIGLGGYMNHYEFHNCIFRRNNTYNSNNGMIAAGTYGPTTSRTGKWSLRHCQFYDNQTNALSSSYTFTPSTRTTGGLDIESSVFYNNGHATGDILIHGNAESEDMNHYIRNSIFYGNTGTALFFNDAGLTDVNYGNSVFGYHITNNIFSHNNKSIDFEAEFGLRSTTIVNNIFWQNTVLDIPTQMSGATGASPSNNYTIDPDFVDPSNGDFRVSAGSTTATKSISPNTAIGNSPIIGTASPSGGGTRMSFS